MTSSPNENEKPKTEEQPSTEANPNGEGLDGRGLATNFKGVRTKHKFRRRSGPGKKRGPYKKNPGPTGSREEPQQAAAGPAAPPPGPFTEEQVKAGFEGIGHGLALYTDCNVWFVEEREAKIMAPSTTLALNAFFPGVASSKWGALTISGLSILGVFGGKALRYLQYRAELARKAKEEELKKAA